MKWFFMFMGLCCTFCFDSCKEKEICIKKFPFDISIVQVIDDKSKPSIGKSANWSPCYKNNCFEFAKDGFDVLLKAKIGPELHNKLIINLNDLNYIGPPIGTFILMRNGVVIGFCKNQFGSDESGYHFDNYDVKVDSGDVYATLRVKFKDCELSDGYFVMYNPFIFRDNSVGGEADRYLRRGFPQRLGFIVKDGKISLTPLDKYPDGIDEMVIKYMKDNNLDNGNESGPATHFLDSILFESEE